MTGKINKVLYLVTCHLLLVTLLALAGVTSRGHALQITQPNLKEIQTELLKLVNAERSLAGVPPVVLDELACRVASEHAADMAGGKFLSHWGSDGRKPYHRYSLAGGVDAMMENVSALTGARAAQTSDLIKDLTYMHLSMHNETPPNDAHRRAILAPQHTHAGFGMAIIDGDLRLVEHYIARYVEVRPFERRVKRKARLEIRGRLLNPEHKLHSADVFYEPLPTAPDAAWLQTPRPYSLPNTFVSLRPKAPENTAYADGGTGEIKMEGTSFTLPVRLFKDAPGLYTVVLWISTRPRERPFVATNICILSD